MLPQTNRIGALTNARNEFSLTNWKCSAWFRCSLKQVSLRGFILLDKFGESFAHDSKLRENLVFGWVGLEQKITACKWGQGHAVNLVAKAGFYHFCLLSFTVYFVVTDNAVWPTKKGRRCTKATHWIRQVKSGHCERL